MKNLIIISSFFMTLSLHAQQSFQCPPETSQKQEKTSDGKTLKFCEDGKGDKLGPIWLFKSQENQQDEPLVLEKSAAVPKPDGSRDIELLARYEYSKENDAPIKEIHFMKDNVVVKNNNYKIKADLSVEVQSKCFSRPRNQYEYEEQMNNSYRNLNPNPSPGMGMGYGYSAPSPYSYYPRNQMGVAVNNFNRVAQSTSIYGGGYTQKEVDCINAEVLAEGYGDHVFQGSRSSKPESRGINDSDGTSSEAAAGSER